MFRRLLLSYLVLIGVTVALLAGIVHLSTGTTFSRYLTDQALVHSEMLPVMLAGYYAQRGTWEGVQPQIDEASALIDAQVTLTDQQGRVVAATRSEVLGHTATAAEDLGLAIPVRGPDGEQAGTVYLGRSLTQRRADAQFLATVTRLLALAGLGVALVGAVLGGMLARSISRPLLAMSQAAERMAQGDYTARVTKFGPDEVGALGRIFNQMAEGMAGVENTRRALVADVSHDLRTPLTVIQGYLEGLRSGDIADRHSAERAFDAMYGETRRLLRLVKDLHYLSVLDGGPGQLDVRPTDVRELVTETLARYASASAGRGVRLQAEVAGAMDLVLLDAERVAQVIVNLVDNALRHTPAGGSMIVAASFEPGAGESGDLVLTVTDTGEGIAPEHLPHIFERFYRVDRARSRTGDGGAGIGLSIVRSIVEAQGGSVSAASEVGRGTRMTVRIPRLRLVPTPGRELT
jgi:signal transduction histidine kinase